MTALTIGLLVFPKVQQLDLTGPYEVFASIPARASACSGRSSTRSSRRRAWC